MYAFQLLNNIKKNYTTTKREALMMVYTLHKYHHYLLSNKFVSYVDHMFSMALFYLVTKWGIDYIGPIKSTRCYIGNLYVLVAVNYVTKWVEVKTL